MLTEKTISATRWGNSQQNHKTVGRTARPPLDLALFSRTFRDASKFDHDQLVLFVGMEKFMKHVCGIYLKNDIRYHANTDILSWPHICRHAFQYSNRPTPISRSVQLIQLPQAPPEFPLVRCATGMADTWRSRWRDRTIEIKKKMGLAENGWIPPSDHF